MKKNIFRALGLFAVVTLLVVGLVGLWNDLSHPNVDCVGPMQPMESLVGKQVTVVGLHQTNDDKEYSVVFNDGEKNVCVNAETQSRGGATYQLYYSNSFVNSHGLSEYEYIVKIGSKGKLTMTGHEIKGDGLGNIIQTEEATYWLYGDQAEKIFGTGKLDADMATEWRWWRSLVVKHFADVVAFPNGLESEEVSAYFLPGQACAMMGKYAEIQQTHSEFSFCQQNTSKKALSLSDYWFDQSKNYKIIAVLPSFETSKAKVLEVGKDNGPLKLVSCQKVTEYTGDEENDQKYNFPYFRYDGRRYFGTLYVYDVDPVGVVLELEGHQVVTVLPQKAIFNVFKDWEKWNYGVKNFQPDTINPTYFSLPESCLKQ